MSPSLIISIIAAVISAIAIYVSIWTHNRNHKLQARIVALEEAREKDRLAEKKKADLRAEIITDSYVNTSGRQTRRHQLRIKNDGLTKARNIKILLDGKSFREHPALSASCVQHCNSEVFDVGAKSHFQYILALSQDIRPPFDLKMTWEDDSGEPGKYSTTLTL